jgi:hypothetical protein
VKKTSVLFASFALSFSMALPACADVLYSQRTDPAASGAWTSQTANGASGFNQAFDNFTLASAASITNVAWTGWVNPDFGKIDGFTISIYADNFDNVDVPGNVGTLLYTTTIVGDAGQTGAGSSGRFGIFNFDADIPSFSAAGSTQYWISIVGDPDSGSADYKWAFSDQGDGTFNNFDGFDVSPITTDLAFTLSNANATPEPSSLLLTGSGIFAVVGVVRRRFAKK